MDDLVTILSRIGAISQEMLNYFLHRTPREPSDMRATGLDESRPAWICLLKLIYVGRLQTVRQFADAIKLPYNIVIELVKWRWIGCPAEPRCAQFR